MNYIMEVMPIFPIVFAITLIIYFIICKLIKNKRKKPSKYKSVAEFTLVGWSVMFLYVTQIMTFGNGLGERINLQPLQPFYIGAKYGLNNAGLISQILLNIAMCVPLGILIPIVFKKCSNFIKVFIVSFGITFVTELSQLLTGRSADIDDIIANTLGGILGFSIYIICYGIYYLIKEKKQEKVIQIKRYSIKLIGAFIVIVLTISPFVIIKILNDKSELGYVYYGHLKPKKVEVSDNISNEESTGIVYKYEKKESIEDLKSRLISLTGFSGEFYNENDTYVLENGESNRIFIYDYNRWSIDYNYGEELEVNKSKLLKGDDAVKLAIEHLEKFGIKKENVKFKEISNEYGDDNLHLIFTDRTNNENEIVWGDLTVALGENGRLLSIDDNRVNFKKYKEVETISPRKSIDIACDVGVGDWNGTAYVSEINASYYFNKDTGFLIPTWKIESTLKAESNNEYEWKPNIDATK